MAKDHPDHHDAEIVMRLYDLRREPVMRQSRDALNSGFWPRSYEDVLAITKSDHDLNRPYRQVATFWEMAYGMVKHGIVNPDFFLESNGEGLVLFVKLEPFLPALRENNPRTLINSEWVVTNTELGRAIADRYRKRFAPARGT